MSLAQRRGDADLVLLVHAPGPDLQVLQDALDESGHAVLLAHDVETGLERALQCLPGLVLLDASLDAFAFTRRLQAGAHTAAIPIIFLAHGAGTEDLLAAVEAGAVDCVATPVRVATGTQP